MISSPGIFFGISVSSARLSPDPVSNGGKKDLVVGLTAMFSKMSSFTFKCPKSELNRFGSDFALINVFVSVDL